MTDAFERETAFASEVADEPAADDPVRQTHLRRQQAEMLARQATRSPFAITIVAAFIAYVVSGHAPLALVGLWGLILIVLLFARRTYALRVLGVPRIDVQPQRSSELTPSLLTEWTQ